MTNIKEASISCDAIVVPVMGAEVDKLAEENSYYAVSNIAGDMYKGTDEGVPTFGVLATFVFSSGVPEDTIYNMVKSIFDNAHMKDGEFCSNTFISISVNLYRTCSSSISRICQPFLKGNSNT